MTEPFNLQNSFYLWLVTFTLCFDWIKFNFCLIKNQFLYIDTVDKYRLLHQLLDYCLCCVSWVKLGIVYCLLCLCKTIKNYGWWWPFIKISKFCVLFIEWIYESKITLKQCKQCLDQKELFFLICLRSSFLLICCVSVHWLHSFIFVSHFVRSEFFYFRIPFGKRK